MSGLYQNARIEQKLDQLIAGGGASGSVAAMPPGYLATFLPDAIPSGWMALNGQSIAISDNPVLYAMFADRYNTQLDEHSTRAAATSLVPAMTAADQPAGYKASASSIYSEAYAAFHAFDGVINSTKGWVTASGVYTGWLRIDLPAAKSITSYSITARGSTGSEPENFTLEGSSDGGSTWTVLDTRIGETGWSLGSTRSYELDAIQLASTYSSIRLNISKSTTPDSYLAIAALVINGGDAVFFPPLGAGQFRVPNLKSSPADLPGAVWCVKAG